MNLIIINTKVKANDGSIDVCNFRNKEEDYILLTTKFIKLFQKKVLIVKI